MIPIRNVYYMLSYAFQVLKETGYKDLATEKFDNTAELMSAILAKGVASQVKRGMVREYIEKTEPLSSVRGRIDITASIKTRSIHKRQLVCSYDDFSANAYMNRILKTAMVLLLKEHISSERKRPLRKLLVFFDGIDTLDIHAINYRFTFNHNNQTYRMLISICYLVIKGLLQTQSSGKTHLMDFMDEQRMCRLYEKFILEYYKKEHPELVVSASQIPWALDDGESAMLPVLQSDVMLSKGNNVLIIDAKYHMNSMQMHYGKRTIHSRNLCQIFTYVKNKDKSFGNRQHTVSGMLLYASTDEAIQPNSTYQMSGNKISVRTLDLNQDFCEIAKQLDMIANEQFGIE